MSPTEALKGNASFVGGKSQPAELPSIQRLFRILQAAGNARVEEIPQVLFF